MAFAALVSLQQTTDLLLNHDKYFISVDERDLIASIREYVTFLISFLEDFPEKPFRLEGKIRDLANEAEDLIEYLMGNQFRINWWSIGLSRDVIEQQLIRVREKIGSITGDLMDDRPAAVSSSRVSPASKIDVVVGLDDDLLEIKGRLRGESSKLEVIPIVGMGGIGKTTLAQNAYDDALVMEYFDIRYWVTVSQDSRVDRILSTLLASINLFKEQILEDKAEKVYKTLKGMRYLIVIDDIWSTDTWDDLRHIFPDDDNGSRIILTSRLSEVAAYASSGSPVHEMKFMDEKRSWDLLKRKVFEEGKDCPPELEDIGREIARRCWGLPLAVVLVAGTLSLSIDAARTRDSWKRIAENVNSAVAGKLDEILSLSYGLLPHHLRPCFLFMAGFPEDHAIYVSELIKLWVAEGFLKHQNRYKSLEDEAEEYLVDLVNRSLVLISSRKSNGNIKSCRLHDLVREMCVSKAQEEKFLVTDSYVLPERRICEHRRISIDHSDLNETWSPTIHTVLCFQNIKEFSSLEFVENFRLLRILDLMCYHHVKAPSQVFELFHLRYLSLGLRNKIPADISNLENLQTLIIRPWGYLRASTSMASYLPLEIWSMPQLRHLLFTDLSYMLPYPAHGPALMPLLNLQTLTGIASFVCSIRILEMIPNLKKLGIVYYSNQEHHDLHNLVHLNQLEKLKITASESFSWQGHYPVFPRTLKKLTLDGGRLPWQDMSIVGSLSNLEVLKLKNHACHGYIWETTDEEFPQLKFLLIENSSLKQWITESIHFPRLKCLGINSCRYLREIPDAIGEISTLEMIEVDSQIESLVNSVKRIQEDQRNYGNDALQVRCNLSDQQQEGTGFGRIKVMRQDEYRGRKWRSKELDLEVGGVEETKEKIGERVE